jgi:hypothetical protein
MNLAWEGNWPSALMLGKEFELPEEGCKVFLGLGLMLTKALELLKEDRNESSKWFDGAGEIGSVPRR